MCSRNSEPSENTDKMPFLFINSPSPTFDSDKSHEVLNEPQINTTEDDLDRKFFVEVSTGGIAGSISAVLHNSKTAEIMDFYIIEDAEDSGIRDKLLEKAEEYCKKKKVEEIRAKIFPDMKEYFRNKGFKTETRLKDHFQRGEDILVVSKILRRK